MGPDAHCCAVAASLSPASIKLAGEAQGVTSTRGARLTALSASRTDAGQGDASDTAASIDSMQAELAN